MSVDLGSSPIDVSKSFGRKEEIEVFSFLEQVVLQHVGDVLVNGYEARGRRATLGLLIELIFQLNFVMVYAFSNSSSIRFSRAASPGIIRKQPKVESPMWILHSSACFPK